VAAISGQVELIGEDLGQWTEFVILDSRLVQVKNPGVMDVSFRRKQRNRERGKDGAAHGNGSGPCGFAPRRLPREPVLPQHSAGAEQ